MDLKKLDLRRNAVLDAGSVFNSAVFVIFTAQYHHNQVVIVGAQFVVISSELELVCYNCCRFYTLTFWADC